ncbi:MAG: hypothetical protein BRD57_06430, partial [Proteobacteria bacterium SW_6_67_9]
LYRFIVDREWSYREGVVTANPANLLVLLISEESVYHSLQQVSFSAWIARATVGEADYHPEDFALGPEARPMMEALGSLFRELGAQPTPSELRKLLHDIEHHVRTADELTHSIYGWTEGLDRTLLVSDRIQQRIAEIMPLIEEFVGFEHVELAAGPDDGSVDDEATL